MIKKISKLKYLRNELTKFSILGINFLVIQYILISNKDIEDNIFLKIFLGINLVTFGAILLSYPKFIYDIISDRAIEFKNLLYLKSYKGIFFFLVLCYLIIKIGLYLFFNNLYNILYLSHSNLYNYICLCSAIFILGLSLIGFLDYIERSNKYLPIFVGVFFLAINVEPLLSTAILLSYLIILIVVIFKQLKSNKKVKIREKELKIFDKLLLDFVGSNVTYQKDKEYWGYHFCNDVIAIRYKKYFDYENIERIKTKISKLNLYFPDSWYCNDPEALRIVILIEDNTDYEDEQLETTEQKYICNYTIVTVKYKYFIGSWTIESKNMKLQSFNDDMNIYQKMLLEKIYWKH